MKLLKHLSNIISLFVIALIIFAAYYFGKSTFPKLSLSSFSQGGNVSIVVNASVPVADYYVFDSNVTIYPIGTYSMNVDGHFIDISGNVTVVHFTGKIILNNSFNMVGKFSEISSDAVTIRHGKIRGLSNVSAEKIVVLGRSSFMFNNTPGTIYFEDGSFDMGGKLVKIDDFAGKMTIGNSLYLRGISSDVEIIGRNRIKIY